MSRPPSLRLCSACARHARADERVCPFCGERLGLAAPPRVRWVSRAELTRAAVVAGAAALWVGCPGDPEPTVYDDGVETTGQERAAHEVDAGPPDAGAADAGDPIPIEPDLDDWRSRPRCTPEGQCPPYGAPPSRERWV